MTAFVEAIRSASMRLVITERDTHAIEMVLPLRDMPKEEYQRGMDCLFRMSDLQAQGTLDQEAGTFRLLLKETPYESLLMQHLSNSWVFRQRLIQALDAGLETEDTDRWRHVQAVMNAPDHQRFSFGRMGAYLGDTLRALVSSKMPYALLGAAAGAMILTTTATHAIKADWLNRALGTPIHSEYVRHITQMHMDRINQTMDAMEDGRYKSNAIEETLRHMTREANYAVNRAIRGVELINAQAYDDLLLVRMLKSEPTKDDLIAMEEARQWMAQVNGAGHQANHDPIETRKAVYAASPH